MSLPTINDVQAVEPVLTNLLIGYMQADDRFVASKVFPIVPTDKDSGTYYIFTKKYWFSDTMMPRAPGGDYSKSGFGVSSTTYKTLQYALAKTIADEERANSQIPMDLEQAAVMWLAQKNLLRKEIAFATDFMATSVWGTSDTTATDWDDFSLGDPYANIRTARRTISNNTGQRANTLVCGLIVADALENHPDIIDRLKYTAAATEVNIKSAIAAIFGLSSYLVAEASYNTADEGQTFSASAIIDDDALVCYVDPSAGIFGATAGKTFSWLPGGGEGLVMNNRLDENDADLIKMKAQWDQKAVATDLGYFFSDIV